MPATMETTAVVFASPGRVEMRELAMPDPRPGEIQVETACSVISAGTEGWMLRDRFTWAPTPFPCVPGYQRVGRVTKVGPGVEGWRIGDRAFATIGVWEGDVGQHQGAHVGLANSAAEEVFAVPEVVADVDAASCVVAQVGYNAAARLTLDEGDWVLVYGDGLIGQFASQAARARGARTILVGHRAERLALAAAHSADEVVDDRDPSFAERVREWVGAQTVDAVLDSVQSEAVGAGYLEFLERGRGQIVYCGFTPGPTWADMGLIQQRELTTHSVSGWSRARIEATLSLMAEGLIRPSPLVTHAMAATSAPDAYEMVLAGSEPFLGIALDWGA